jgi:hypothetical protein
MGRFCKGFVDDNIGTKRGRLAARPFSSALTWGTIQVIPTHHTFDTTFCVDNPLFTRPERMAFAADFCP